MAAFDQQFILQNLDFTTVPEKFHQDPHTIPGGEDLCDECFQSLEDPSCDHHVITGLDFQWPDFVFAVADVETNLVNRLIRNHAWQKAEPDNAVHALGAGDKLLVLIEAEPGKEVPGKKRLAEPDAAPSCHLLETEPGRTDFDAFDEADMRGRYVLALLLGTEAEPGQTGGFWKSGKPGGSGGRRAHCSLPRALCCFVVAHV